ncbi:MAG: hypothetical protein ACR2OB_11595 [Solirubrobacteraceae bacterium]
MAIPAAAIPAVALAVGEAPDGDLAAGLADALARISTGAGALDAEPRFPAQAMQALAPTGILGLNLPGRGATFADELSAVRSVAAADGSVGRIFDGHLNAIERLVVAGRLGAGEAARISAGELLLGVWGADPARGEGEPARLEPRGDDLVVNGVKTFCSGAGGVQRALVVVGAGDGTRRLAYVDLSQGVKIDRTWYRGAGLRASESHRVQFDGARVIDVLGGPGELLRAPYFSRDALRTSATWAGIADRMLTAATEFAREAGRQGELAGLAVGRISVARATIDRWLDRAGAAAGAGEALEVLAIEGRYAISAACREIIAAAAELCGSRPLARGEALDRASRDLNLFLLQHRLEPLLARHGSAILEAGRG